MQTRQTGVQKFCAEALRSKRVYKTTDLLHSKKKDKYGYSSIT